MATPSEQKALAFVAMIVLLGGVVRVVRAGHPTLPSVGEQQALARQATAAESAAAAARPASRGGRAARSRPRGAAPADTTPRGGAIGGGTPPAAPVGVGGYAPPAPRIDLDYRANRRISTSRVSGGSLDAGAVSEPLIDLDRAAEGEIDRLPRVGPALARRLVANRDSFGAFGSLEALGRVRGFGPATRKRLAPLVTFSGRPSSRR